MIRRYRTGLTLAEVLVASTLWSLLALAMTTVLQLGLQGLQEADRAGRLALAAARLEAELGRSVRHLAPRSDTASESLLLARSDGGTTTLRLVDDSLVARDTDSGEDRVIAAGLQMVRFHPRRGPPAIVRYVLVLDGRCLISASRLGVTT